MAEGNQADVMDLTKLTLHINPTEQVNIGADVNLRFRRDTNGGQWRVTIQAPKEMKILRVKLAAPHRFGSGDEEQSEQEF